MKRYKQILMLTAVGLALAVTLLLGTRYRTGLATWVLASSTAQSPQATPEKSAGNPDGSSPKRILYWYDSMNPSQHSGKPGKAPDGMDLVPWQPLFPRYVVGFAECDWVSRCADERPRHVVCMAGSPE